MRITITLLLFICCACGVLKKNSRTEKVVQSYDSSFTTSVRQVVGMEQIRTATKVYGDTLKGGFTLPLDSIIPPVWLESTGLAVGVDARMEAGRLRLNVSAIAKPTVETLTSQRSAYKFGQKGQTAVVQINKTATVSQSTSSKWVIPWYIYLIVGVALVFLIYKMLKRSIQ